MATNSMQRSTGTKFGRFDGTNIRYAAPHGGTLITGYYSTVLDVPEGFVACVHEILITSTYAAGDGDVDKFTDVRLDGASRVMTFAHPSVAARGQHRNYVWRPNGRLIVEDSFEAKTSQADRASIGILYELKRKDAAVRDGEFEGVPFASGHGSITPSNYLPVVPASGDLRFHIKGMSITGFPRVAGPVDFQVVFDNGSTRRVITKTVLATNDPEYDAQVFIDECDIIGPRGYGVSVYTTNASVATDVKLNVFGSYVDHDDVWDETGQPLNAGTITGGRNFWFYTADTTVNVPQAMFPNSGTEKVAIMEGCYISGISASGSKVGYSRTATIIPPVQMMTPAFHLGVPGSSQHVCQKLYSPTKVNSSSNNLYSIRVLGAGAIAAIGSTVWGKIVPAGNYSDTENAYELV